MSCVTTESVILDDFKPNRFYHTQDGFVTQSQMKFNAAEKSLEFIQDDSIIGIGTGTTVNCLIDLLPKIRGRFKGAVPSSHITEKKLKEKGIPIFNLNEIDHLALYIDGADQVNSLGQLIKGGGGALTREKILAEAAKKFICIVDEDKTKDVFGTFPLAIEVIEMARSFVARQVVKLGGKPRLRSHFVTDNGHIILDVDGLKMERPIELEQTLNNIPGIVCHGLFAMRGADMVVIGQSQGAVIKTYAFK